MTRKLSHKLCSGASGKVAAVKASETPGSLWGEDKPDPKDALAKEGFQMRRVVLSPKINSETKKI